MLSTVRRRRAPASLDLSRRRKRQAPPAPEPESPDSPDSDSSDDDSGDDSPSPTKTTFPNGSISTILPTTINTVPGTTVNTIPGTTANPVPGTTVPNIPSAVVPAPTTVVENPTPTPESSEAVTTVPSTLQTSVTGTRRAGLNTETALPDTTGGSTTVLQAPTEAPLQDGQNQNQNQNQNDQKGDGLPGAAIAGIIIGILAGVALIAFLFWRYKREYDDNATVITSISNRSKRILAKIRGGNISGPLDPRPEVYVTGAVPVARNANANAQNGKDKTQSQVLNELIVAAWDQQEPGRIQSEYYMDEKRGQMDRDNDPPPGVAMPDTVHLRPNDDGTGKFQDKPRRTIINWLSSTPDGEQGPPKTPNRFWRNTGVTGVSLPSSVSTERRQWG